jgi:hypothetical protein
MSLNNVLLMLLGAVLVAIGVLAAALADRIRGLRITRASRVAREPETYGDEDLPIVVAARKKRRAPVPSAADTIFVADSPVEANQHATNADDVVDALVAAGYKKSVATDAVWSCEQADRATIERWAAAALRRTRGGMS